MAARKKTRMSDLDGSKTVRGWVSKYKALNASLRSEKKAFGKQVDRLLGLLVKEGKKPFKVNAQYNFTQKKAFVEPGMGSAKDSLIVDFDGKRHTFKV